MSYLENHLEALDGCATQGDREAMLAQLLSTAWTQGYGSGYDGNAMGEDANPYRPALPGEPATYREALARQAAQQQADAQAEALARCTGSTSATYTHTEPGGTTIVGRYAR